MPLCFVQSQCWRRSRSRLARSRPTARQDVRDRRFPRLDLQLWTRTRRHPRLGPRSIRTPGVGRDVISGWPRYSDIAPSTPSPRVASGSDVQYAAPGRAGSGESGRPPAPSRLQPAVRLAVVDTAGPRASRHCWSADRSAGHRNALPARGDASIEVVHVRVILSKYRVDPKESRGLVLTAIDNADEFVPWELLTRNANAPRTARTCGGRNSTVEPVKIGGCRAWTDSSH